MASAFRYTLIPVFATTVFAHCIFVIVCFTGSDVAKPYNYFAALVCAMVSLIVNYRFSSRERSLVSVVVLNAVLIALTEFVVFSAPNAIEGFWPHTIAGVCVAAPVIHGLVLSQEPVGTNAVMMYCDISILGTIFLFAVQIGDFTAPALTNIVSVAALLLNLFLLSALRGKGPAKKTEEGRKKAAKGTVLTAVLAGIVCAAAFVAAVLLPVSRYAIFAAAAGARDMIVFVGEAIERFFRFLLLLFPASRSELPGMPAPDMGDMGGMEGVVAEEAATGLFTRVFVICVAIAGAFFLIALFRFRKHRLNGRKPNAFAYETDEYEGASLFRFLLSLPARFKAWLLYRKCRVLRRGTYEDAYLVISRRAKRRGVRRAPAETQWAFLGRVAERFPVDERTMDGILVLLAAVSAAADKRLYSGKDADPAAYATLTNEDAQSLALLLSAIKHLKK